ncbi:cation/calcium exchanger 5-like [Aristolochia californica]|uniref:cation/calcium exchanger 5-like n=1 Tax=Aristolochia californica TaxID=171875 RepID=UPI0035DD4065
MALTVLKTFLITITLLSVFIFFAITSTHPHRNQTHFRSLLQSSSLPICSSPNSSDSLINYSYLHFCIFNEDSFISVPFLSLILLFCFYFLIQTVESHFSRIVTTLSDHFNLSPSMGAVSLLALGNGAPDVFASISAVRSGRARTGFGAILSAGAFVSAFVVGLVAVHAAPFAVDPAPFVRDVFFYLIAALALFYVYLTAEIYLWQAVGFVGFYLFFVGFVVWMDVGAEKERRVRDVERCSWAEDSENTEVVARIEHDEKPPGSSCEVLGKVTRLWELPVSTLLKLTVPSATTSEWSRFYTSANIALCPLATMYSFRSLIPFNLPVIFLLPNTLFPLWSVVLCTSLFLAVLNYLMDTEPPQNQQLATILTGFVMSVFWISTVAGELLECLSALGSILELPPQLLGLTVLAWGNSVGDLVADVAVAKAGQPAMAMAGCFAGPMFNLLVGLGTALVLQTADVYPDAYELRFHISIIVAFVFLLLSLMGSLLVVTWHGFRVPRFWGYCLVGLYSVFIVISLIIAKFLG